MSLGDGTEGLKGVSERRVTGERGPPLGTAEGRPETVWCSTEEVSWQQKHQECFLKKLIKSKMLNCKREEENNTHGRQFAPVEMACPGNGSKSVGPRWRVWLEKGDTLCVFRLVKGIGPCREKGGRGTNSSDGGIELNVVIGDMLCGMNDYNHIKITMPVLSNACNASNTTEFILCYEVFCDEKHGLNC